MMKYTIPTVAKALFAFFSAFSGVVAATGHGVDLSGLDAGQWMTAIGTALVAGGGVFTIPNKSTEPVASPADQAITGIQATIEQVAQATSELDRVRTAATDIAGQVPVLGPLAQQVINSLPRL